MLNLVVSYLPCVDVFYSLLLAAIISIDFFKCATRRTSRHPCGTLSYLLLYNNVILFWFLSSNFQEKKIVICHSYLP
jgi:hypothetical protein